MELIQPKNIIPPVVGLKGTAVSRDRRYITKAAIASANAYPGQAIPLADEALVPETYAPQILKQARKVNENFNLYFSLTKRSPSSKGYFKGHVYLVNGDFQGELPNGTVLVQMPKQKKEQASKESKEQAPKETKEQAPKPESDRKTEPENAVEVDASKPVKWASVTADEAESFTSAEEPEELDEAEEVEEQEEVEEPTDEQIFSILRPERKKDLLARRGYSENDLAFGIVPSASELLSHLTPQEHEFMVSSYHFQKAVAVQEAIKRQRAQAAAA